MIVGYGEQAAVGVAGMVHEARRATHKHPVTDVFVGDVVGIFPHFLAVFHVRTGFSSRNLLNVLLDSFRESLNELGLSYEFWLAKLVETHEVIGFIGGTLIPTLVRFFNGDDLASVGVNEIALA